MKTSTFVPILIGTSADERRPKTNKEVIPCLTWNGEALEEVNLVPWEDQKN